MWYLYKIPDIENKTTDSRVNKRIFVVQKHQARNLHYDFRIEVEGVLKSWAVPKGVPTDTDTQRLAIMVEDHDYEYKDFEGEIKEGYGKGTVEIWDKGWYEEYDVKKPIVAGLQKGRFKIRLYGEKLNGIYTLSKMKDNNWLISKNIPEEIRQI